LTKLIKFDIRSVRKNIAQTKWNSVAQLFSSAFMPRTTVHLSAAQCG